MEINNGTSKKYKHVQEVIIRGEKYYRIKLRGVGTTLFKDERAVALMVDKYLIKLGKEPVNILKRKTNEHKNQSK